MCAQFDLDALFIYFNRTEFQNSSVAQQGRRGKGRGVITSLRVGLSGGRIDLARGNNLPTSGAFTGGGGGGT